MRITEVEAYLGPDDRACHTYGGRRTARRVESMWGEAGHAYVYLIYGLHHCLNLVTVGPGWGRRCCCGEDRRSTASKRCGAGAARWSAGL